VPQAETQVWVGTFKRVFPLVGQVKQKFLLESEQVRQLEEQADSETSPLVN
jgi:hypothetical protein